MTTTDKPKLGWRGKVRMALLKVTKDPLLMGRVELIEEETVDSLKRLATVENTVNALALRDHSVGIIVPVHKAQAGIEGRIQAIEQKLSAIQTRLDVLTLNISAARAEKSSAKSKVPSKNTKSSKK